MAICAILGQKLDSRKDGDDCLFNGYLEDYLSLRENEIENNLKETFEKVLQAESRQQRFVWIYIVPSTLKQLVTKSSAIKTSASLMENH